MNAPHGCISLSAVCRTPRRKSAPESPMEANSWIFRWKMWSRQERQVFRPTGAQRFNPRTAKAGKEYRYEL